MLLLKEHVEVYVSTKNTDMRKSLDGLTFLVIEHLDMAPQSPAVFVFYNHRRDKVKLLYWDRNGFILHYKRLEKGKFKFPKEIRKSHYTISHQELQWLLAGLDFHLMSLFPDIDYTDYF